jgi:hypothetical protein
MTFVLGVTGLLLVAAVTYAAYRRSDFGLAMLLAAELFHVAFGPNAAMLGGLHITPSDAAAIVLLAAGVIRRVRAYRTLDLNGAIIAGCLALFALSIVRGILTFGLTVAGNESRAYVAPLAALLYFSTVSVEERDIRRYALSYIGFGVALCGIALGSAAGLPIGIMAWEVQDIAFINGRYLPATGAAALAVCGFLSLAVLQYRRSGWWPRALLVLFFGFAVYMRHRTVWIMLLAGFAVLLPLDSRLFRRVVPFALAAVVVVAIVAGYEGGAQGQGGEEQFSDAVSNGQTFAWRLNGWAQLLLDDDQTALTVMIGKSMGSGFWRLDLDTHQTVVVAPHNEYIQTYLRIGVIGVLLILLFTVRTLMQLWRLAKIGNIAVFPSASAWAVVVLATLVFGLAYGIEPHSYALLGIANAIGTHAGALAWAQEEREVQWELQELNAIATESA